MHTYFSVLMEAIHGSGHKFWFDTKTNQFYLFDEDHCDFVEDNFEEMGIPEDQVAHGGDYERNYKLAFERGYVRGGFEGETSMYFCSDSIDNARKAVKVAYQDFPAALRMRIDLVDDDFQTLQWITLKHDDIRHFARTGMAPRRLVAESQDDQPHYFLHVTSAKNIPSITERGLIPNHTSNYDSLRWVALDGVYASKNVDLLNNYLNAHGISDFAAVVIETQGGDHLPDEDIIDINFSRAFEKVINSLGLSIDEVVEQYLEDECTIDPDAPLWSKTLELFLKSAGQPAKPYSNEQLFELLDWWFAVEHAESADALLDWGKIKDDFIRAYPHMVNAVTQDQHSVRFPKAVTRDGQTRIVAVIRVKDDFAPEFVYDAIPPAARANVEIMLDGLING